MKTNNQINATANPATPATRYTYNGDIYNYKYNGVFYPFYTFDKLRAPVSDCIFYDVNGVIIEVTESPAEATTEESKPAPVGIFRDDRQNIFIITCDAKKINIDELREIIADETTPASVKLSALDILNRVEREEKDARETQANFDRCNRIADELDDIANGQIYKCPHCGALVNLDFEEKDGESVATCSNCNDIINEDDTEPLSAWEYFDDCLDVEYVTNAQKEYKAVKICIAWGGPSIYVDTDAGAVCLYWWGQTARAYLSSSARDMVDEWAQSYFDI